MKLAALVMAGGRGERLRRSEEKPLVRVAGKPMVERVLEALRTSKLFDGIFVAATRRTPRTIARVAELGFVVVETPGRGYHADLKHAVKALALRCPVVTVTADLPLLRASTVCLVVGVYYGCGKPALATFVPRLLRENLGLAVEPTDALEVAGLSVVPAGLNVVDGSLIDEPEIPQADLVLDSVDLAVNVNIEGDLAVAERLASRPSELPPAKVLAIVR